MTKFLIATIGIIFSLTFTSLVFGMDANNHPVEPSSDENVALEFETTPDVILVGQVACVLATPNAETTLITGTLNGQIQMDSNGSFTYKPNEGFEGMDVFMSETCDTLGNCRQTITYINVLPTELVLGDIVPTQNFESYKMADGAVQLLSTEKDNKTWDNAYYIYYSDGMGHYDSQLVGLTQKDANPQASELIKKVSEGVAATVAPKQDLMTYFE